MPRDGSGNYSVPNTFLPNTVMSATAVNANFTDAGTALTGSLPRDGQAAMTGQFLAIAGTEAAPGISFGADPNTGFRRASEDDIRIVTGGLDRFYIDSTGKAFALYGMNISGDIGLTAPIVIATTSASLLTLRRTENDTSERTLEEYQSGSGAGAKGRLSSVGDGNNSVTTLRWKVNEISVFDATQSLFTVYQDVAIGSSIAIDTAGYIDLAEISTPSTPAANTARLYAVDVAGVTKLQFKDGSGNVTSLPQGADLQTFTGSGTWTKPSYGTIAFIQAWGGGASGGRGGSGDGGGGGGGGAYSEKYIALASLSASVSVTIGAGGAAQTADNTAGNVGGNTTFGAYLTAYGAAAGGGSGADNSGGGGGGLSGAGSGTTGGGPTGTIGGVTTGAADNANPFGGGGGATTSGSAGGTGLYGGGGGGFGSQAASPTAGGSSVFGGGGGGGGADTAAGASGGTAVIYGGNGGAGGTDTTQGTAGTAPGGGGGGSENANSGAGARGEVRVTVW